MKQTIISYAIIVVICLAFGFFMGGGCEEKEDLPEGYIEGLRDENDSLKAEIFNSENKAEAFKREAIRQDSEIQNLEKLIKKQQNQLNVAYSEINRKIKEDSSNAIEIYRSGLSTLYPDYKPSPSPLLTYEEIGLGALTFPETKGLRLTVNLQSEALERADSLKESLYKVIDETEFQRDGWKQTSKNNQEIAFIYKSKYDKTQSFWHHRFGIQIGTYVIYSADGRIVPGIGIGVGINLYLNE